MNHIERLLQTLAPKGVEFRKLGEVCESTNKKTLKISEVSEVKNKGMYPVINSGRDLYGYYHDFNNDGENITIASRGEYAGFINYFNEKFFAGGLCYPYKVKDTNELLTKFLYFYLKTNEIQIMENLVFRGSIPALNKADIETLTIPIPPLEIQQEIVKILDAFTELNTELNTELKARKKQYQYYQNMLLDFNDINQNHKDAKMSAKTYPKRLKTLLQTLAPKGVEFKKIGELFKRNKGINITAAQMKELHSEIGKVRIFAGGATKADINYKDISKKDIINCESVIIKSRGNIGFEYYNQPFSHKNEIWSYSSKTNQMLVKFLYYYLSNNQDYFQKLAQSSSVKLPQLSVSDTDEYEVPIPPLEIQQEIVKILDQFSILTTDLLAGIPAEIEARKKQYEYYREKLLTFKPLTPNKEVKKC
ncbi:restriction endonuclease subunit S [Helicobacter pylori]|uniref:restriction endonuclease subunit S n=1 Tax=Helicobacter pylori TaxID=210 RepID=UPI000FDF06AA|nr:restriction endonuclease subunit S [Helicobacter pylori]RVZ91079.1 restriction endonuclease subunit S [Helicobacter pylori]